VRCVSNCRRTRSSRFFLYVADKEEGLIIVGDPDLKSKSPGVGTLLDGNPANNFLKRALAFNPGGILTGAHRIAIAGTYAYVLTIGAPALNDPRGIAVQFRYAFAADRDGLKVLDVTDLAQPKLVANALVPLEDARNVYVARTYAYVSAGKQGLATIDVEKPDAPKLDQIFSAEGQLNDVNDVKIGVVAASAYAFVADGKSGLHVLQIISPWDDPTHFSGFSPRPTPKLIATGRTRGSALAISKGIDRDRAVMNLATNSPFLVDVAPVPLIKARPRLSTSATASYTPSPTTPGSIQVKLVRQEALGSNACKLGF